MKTPDVSGKVKKLLVLSIVLAVSACLGTVSFGQREGVNDELEEFDFANGLFSRGMYEMAAKGYTAFLEKYPRSEHAELARFRISESFFMDKKYDEALKSFDSFIKKYPKSPLSLKAELREAQAYYLKEDYARAEKIFSGLAREGTSPEVAVPAKYYLAGIDFKQGDYSTARNILEDLTSGPQDNEYMPFIYMNLGDIYTELGEGDKAAEAYGKAAAGTRKGSVAFQADIRAGNAFYRAGDHAKAAAYYSKVVDDPSSPYGLFEDAAVGLLSALSKEGKYADTASWAEKVLPRVKNGTVRSQVLFILGNSYFHEDRFEEAQKVFTEAYEKYPDEKYGIRSALNSSWTLYKLGKLDQCVERADAYMAQSKDSADEALYIKAKALAGMGREKEALGSYKTILAGHKGTDYYKEALYDMGWFYSDMGDQEEALRYYAAFAEEYPDDERSPAVLLKAGQESLKLGRLKEAEKFYNGFLSKYSKDPLKENVMYQLGRLYMEREDHDKAISTYKRFMEDFPDSKLKDSAYFWTGRAYQKKQEWDKAIEVYSGLIRDTKGELYPTGAESMAYCYYQKGEPDKAAKAYFTLMTKARDYKLPEGVYRWVAGHYLEKGDTTKSLLVLASFTKEYPDLSSDGDITYMFADNYRKMGDNERAEKFFRKALDGEISPLYRERSYLGLGRVQAAKGEYEKARENLEKALKGHSDNKTGALARFELGNLYFKKTDYAEAAKQYLMVAILYEDRELCSEALYKAGLSFEKAGNPEKSAEVFKELVERYPDDPLSKKVQDRVKTANDEKS